VRFPTKPIPEGQVNQVGTLREPEKESRGGGIKRLTGQLKKLTSNPTFLSLGGKRKTF